jgi:hypothetical protein
MLRLIDGSDGQEKSLLEMVGGGTPAPRADLRFGLDDAGAIYLVTKRDGTVRRLVAIGAVPTAAPVAWGILGLLLTTTALSFLKGDSGEAPPTSTS